MSVCPQVEICLPPFKCQPLTFLNCHGTSTQPVLTVQMYTKTKLQMYTTNFDNTNVHKHKTTNVHKHKTTNVYKPIWTV